MNTLILRRYLGDLSDIGNIINYYTIYFYNIESFDGETSGNQLQIMFNKLKIKYEEIKNKGEDIHSISNSV